MIVLNARNVSEAWATFHVHIKDRHNVRIVAPRGAKTLEFTSPVATVYRCPEECVLLDPARDANPFFHLYEALWILCGFNDVSRVKYYSAQIAEYSDDQEVFHGAYGYRMRSRFGVDQIEAVVDTLRRDPWSRRAVIGLWGAGIDVTQEASGGAKDIPCNTTLYFKVREGRLHMTVCNRSNDAVWGCYGANAVHFSFLHQYIAARLGLASGTYTQISDSLHVYLDGKPGEVWERCRRAPPPLLQSYTPSVLGVAYTPLIKDALRFYSEARQLLADPSGVPVIGTYQEPFLRGVALPILAAHQVYRNCGAKDALSCLAQSDEAWHVAAYQWLLRRVK
jgi:hypothetical protein